MNNIITKAIERGSNIIPIVASIFVNPKTDAEKSHNEQTIQRLNEITAELNEYMSVTTKPISL